jgi:hypothetical protein
VTTRIDLGRAGFAGTSRSYTTFPFGGRRAWPTCTSCGSTLAGRWEKTVGRVVRGVRYEVDVFRCGCGRGRHIRRRA